MIAFVSPGQNSQSVGMGRWEDVVRRLASEGVSTYVEVGPGTVLSGLVKKIQPDARVLTFGSPTASARS